MTCQPKAAARRLQRGRLPRNNCLGVLECEEFVKETNEDVFFILTIQAKKLGQLDIVAVRSKQPRPVVRAAAGFHANPARRELRD